MAKCDYQVYIWERNQPYIGAGASHKKSRVISQAMPHFLQWALQTQVGETLREWGETSLEKHRTENKAWWYNRGPWEVTNHYVRGLWTKKGRKREEKMPPWQQLAAAMLSMQTSSTWFGTSRSQSFSVGFAFLQGEQGAEKGLQGICLGTRGSDMRPSAMCWKGLGI